MKEHEPYGEIEIDPKLVAQPELGEPYAGMSTAELEPLYLKADQELDELAGGWIGEELSPEEKKKRLDELTDLTTLMRAELLERMAKPGGNTKDPFVRLHPPSSPEELKKRQDLLNEIMNKRHLKQPEQDLPQEKAA